MKNPLHKRTLRQFARPWKMVPVLIALVFVVVFASSFFTSQDSVRALYEKQITDGKVEDGEFTTIAPLSDDAVKKLEEKGVKLYENFSLELSETPQKQLRAFENRKDINIAQILEGRLPENDHEVALSGNYARANKLALSDTIKLEEKMFDIVGIISLPDYSSILRSRSDLLMDTGYFGTCLLHEDGFERFQNLPVKYTYSYHTETTLDKKAASDKLRTLVEVVSEDNRVIDGVTRFDNHCITYIMDDMGGDVPMMTVAMVLLFIALAFISAVQVKSMIEKEAPVIGTLLASGYTKRELVANYMATPVLLTVIASVIGNVLSYTYFYKAYADLYYDSFDLPAFEPILNARSFLLTSVCPFVIYLVVNFFVISKALEHRPIQFLRNNLRKEKKKSSLKLHGFSFLQKFRIRIALGNKFGLAALIFGVFLANLLLLFGLVIKPIFMNYTDNMSDTIKYAHVYFVRTEEPNLNVEKATLLKAELIDEDDKEVDLYGVDAHSHYAIPHRDALEKDEVVISHGLAQRFSYDVGDELTIREPFRQKEVRLKIKDILPENTAFQIFTTRAYLNEIVGEDADFFNAYHSDEKLTLSKDNLVTELDKERVANYTRHFLNSFGVVFDMLFYVGIAFYIIIVSMMTGVILDKSERHMSYLKIFGFRDREISSLYVNGLLVFLVVFQLVMIPAVDKLLQGIIRVSMAKLDAYMIFRIPIQKYFTAILYSAIIFLAIQFFQHIKISKLDMTKELKNIAG